MSQTLAFAQLDGYPGGMLPAVLVATWSDGVFVLTEAALEQEFAGLSVQGLTSDGQGGALAIVDKNTLRRRSADGTWSILATADGDLSCCVATRGAVYVALQFDRAVIATGDPKDIRRLSAPYPQVSLMQL